MSANVKNVLAGAMQDAGMEKMPNNVRSVGPVWKGPEVDGVTYSMLSRFLCCRERFRVLVVDGLRAARTFNHRIEYGNMWHVCEDAHARGVDPLHQEPQYPGSKDLTWGELKAYAAGLCEAFRTNQQQINHWYNICKTQFPLYVKYWSNHPDMRARRSLLQEQVFNVLYRLPSGRTVRLRGKWDSVDLTWHPSKGDRSGAVWLQENKTKGDIKPSQVERQLTMDLQTMMYLVALQEEQQRMDDSAIKSKLSYRDGQFRVRYPMKGVRYNVVRRPLSGGKGTITRHKATKTKPEETENQFMARLGSVIAANPGEFFMRWNVEVTADDLARFRRRCLDPILEQLCQWWDMMSLCADNGIGYWDVVDASCKVGGPRMHDVHWQHPFGVYNVLDEGGSSDLDDHLATGSETGLERVTELFEELRPAVR